MPELPEVETVRTGLLPLLGVAIRSVEIRRSDVIVGLGAAPALGQEQLLAGSSIIALHRRGKQLAIEGSTGRVVVVQLGMSGQLRLELEDAELARHTHVVWTLADGRKLTFRDPRRFGGLTLIGSVPALQAHWSTLGPDALGVTRETLAAACARTRRSIKAVLLDQDAVAGVGNIYADEALFLAGVRPTRAAHRLNARQLEELAAAIRGVLAAGIAAGGSTLRDYVGVLGEAGEAQHAHRVYGRGGLRCVQCDTSLRKTVVTQRTTVYCPRCQP